MITFIAVLLVICCGLVILIGFALSSQLSEIDDIVTRIEYIVREINKRLPYDGWFISTHKDLNEKLDAIKDHLTTEIAILATKNNEDIKRMNGNYEIGDILKFDGIRWYIFGKDLLNDGRTRWKLFGENGAEYRIYTDAIPEGIEFLGHRDLSFE